jgi:hypothetical protein
VFESRDLRAVLGSQRDFDNVTWLQVGIFRCGDLFPLLIGFSYDRDLGLQVARSGWYRSASVHGLQFLSQRPHLDAQLGDMDAGVSELSKQGDRTLACNAIDLPGRVLALALNAHEFDRGL